MKIKDVKGKYFRKKNWEVFKDDKIYIHVNHIKLRTDGAWLLNGKIVMDMNQLIELSQDEALSLQKELDNFPISKPMNFSENRTCYTRTNEEKTSQPKRQYDEKKAKQLAFKYGKRFPNFKYDAYKCPHCKMFHFGKRPPDRLIEKHIVIKKILFFFKKIFSFKKKILF